MQPRQFGKVALGEGGLGLGLLLPRRLTDQDVGAKVTVPDFDVPDSLSVGSGKDGRILRNLGLASLHWHTLYSFWFVVEGDPSLLPAGA